MTDRREPGWLFWLGEKGIPGSMVVVCFALAFVGFVENWLAGLWTLAVFVPLGVIFIWLYD